MSFFKEALKPKHKMTIRKSAHKRSGRQRIFLSGFIQPSKSITRKGKHSFGSIFGRPAKQRARKVAGRRQTIVIRRQPLLAPPMRQQKQRQYTYGLSDFIQAPPARQQAVRQPVAERTVMTQRKQPVQRQSFASRGIDDLIQPARSGQQQQQQGGGLIQAPKQQASQVSEQVGGFFQPSAEVSQRQAETRANLGQAGQNLYKGARTVGESLYGGAKYAYGKAEEVYKKVRPSRQPSEPVEQQESVEPTGSEEYEAEEFAEETAHSSGYKPKYY